MKTNMLAFVMLLRISGMMASCMTNNELYDGYSWHEAYYLYPIGISDLRTASSDRDLNTSNMYQNINWPAEAGGHALK